MFSEVVDRLVKRGGFHSNELPMVINAVNAAIRSLDSDNRYLKSTVEDSITIVDPAATSYIWAKPNLFVRLLTSKYVPTDVFPKQRQPGQHQIGETYFWYEQAQKIVFNGVSGLTSISVFYHVRPRRFAYYEANLRPAVFNDSTFTWSYPTGAGTEEAQLAAQDLVYHWLLADWSDAVEETALATIWKDTKDEAARSTFALAKQYRADIKGQEQTANYEYQ